MSDYGPFAADYDGWSADDRRIEHGKPFEDESPELVWIARKPA